MPVNYKSENGDIIIENAVLADLAGISAMECDGRYL